LPLTTSRYNPEYSGSLEMTKIGVMIKFFQKPGITLLRSNWKVLNLPIELDIAQKD